MHENDGERDEDGNCLGQVYIFTGKASRCRPPGLKVGLLNDCCDDGDKAMSDSVGSALDVYGAINTIKTVYRLGQVAYFTDKLTGLTRGVNFDIFYFQDGTANIVNYGTEKITEVTAEVAKAIDAGLTAGTGVEGAITHFIKNLFNPTTILISVAVMIVTKLLFGSCDQNDITTVLLRDSKYCHFVGDYCEKKWPIIGCVQKAKGYCCFNSKLGRIIHEQGRPQLESFGRNGGWGKAKKPNCRGFKPEEFQMLDFSKIDISEYIEDIQKDMDKKLNNMQKNLSDEVNNFFNPGAN
jgi:conjugal transfer mating pair stabilization protein TraN